MDEYRYGYFALRVIVEKALEHLEKGDIDRAADYLREVTFVEAEMAKLRSSLSIQTDGHDCFPEGFLRGPLAP